MVQIHIADNKTDEILDFIPESEFWNDVRKRELKDNRDTFDFETFATESYSGAIEERNRIIIPNKGENSYSEFIIDEAAQIMDGAGLHYKEAYCSASYLELRKQKLIAPQTVNAQSPQQHVAFALDGTEWDVGNIEYGENHTTVLTAYSDAYSYLLNIAAWSGMELRFRVEHNGQRITGRYVDLVERAGMWRGHEAVFGVDLLEVTRRRKYGNVVTALLGVGPENDDDSPRETVYVENNAALQRWGRNGQHLVEIFEPESEDQNINPEKLLRLTTDELNRRISHQSEYTATIATLSETMGVDPADLQFGDVIRIKDEDFNIPLYLEARIHTMEESIKHYEESTVTLGDFTEFTEGQVKAILKKLQAQINAKIGNAELAELVGGFEPKRITQPTPPEDTTAIWVDNSSIPYVPKVYVTAVGGWVKMSHTTAEEVGADPEGSAASALTAAREDIAEVVNELDAFKNQYDDFIADGFISRAEALSIERHIASLSAEKKDLDADYTATYGNPELTGAEKTALQSAKSTFNNAHSALVSAINTAIADGYVTAAEKTSVNNAFVTYENALGAYSTARANAVSGISAKQAADAKAEAIAAAATDAQTKATAARDAAITAANIKAEAEREIAKTYADGIVSDEEDDRITAINNALITAAADAQTKANAAVTAAEEYADTVSGDARVAAEEEALRLAGLAEQAAIDHANAIETALAEDISTLSTSLSGFQTTVNGTFKDGIVQEAEAKAIEKYKNSLNAEKLDVDNRFTKIYAEPALLGSPKTNLDTAKTAYNTAHTNLISSINAAILDGKATATEKADVDAKFTAYRTALGTLSTRFEEAISALTSKKASDAETNAITAAELDASIKANDAQAAADLYAQEVADAMLLNAEVYADNLVTAEEQARIDDANAKLLQAQEYAEIKAQEAAAAIDLSNLATKTELEQEAEDLREQISSRNGANVLRNSIGYAGDDYWTQRYPATPVSTVMNPALRTIGYGCGFFFDNSPGTKSIEQIVNVEQSTAYTLSWVALKATTGTFTIEILDGTTVVASSQDISPAGNGFMPNFITFEAPAGQVAVRFTAAANVEITLSGVMLAQGTLPVPWSLATGELYNAVVRTDEKGILVLGLDDDGRIERKTVMSPEEFAGYYDENRDGTFERVFWLNEDETVTKKLRALEEITMGTVKIVRINSTASRGWAFVPIVQD